MPSKIVAVLPRLRRGIPYFIFYSIDVRLLITVVYHHISVHIRLILYHLYHDDVPYCILIFTHE